MGQPLTRTDRQGAVDAPGGDQRGGQYLTFNLGSEMYGLGILSIKEIIQYGGVSKVPMLPDFIRGVINLRGTVVPVVDLTARFNGHLTQTARRNCIVIVETGGDDGNQDVGLVVDSVSAVVEIPAADIEPPPAFGVRIESDFIDGMGKVDGHFTILLNLERVLDADGLAALASAGGSGVSA